MTMIVVIGTVMFILLGYCRVFNIEIDSGDRLLINGIRVFDGYHLQHLFRNTDIVDGNLRDCKYVVKVWPCTSIGNLERLDSVFSRFGVQKYLLKSGRGDMVNLAFEHSVDTMSDLKEAGGLLVCKVKNGECSIVCPNAPAGNLSISAGWQDRINRCFHYEDSRIRQFHIECESGELFDVIESIACMGIDLGCVVKVFVQNKETKHKCVIKLERYGQN